MELLGLVVAAAMIASPGSPPAVRPPTAANSRTGAPTRVIGLPWGAAPGSAGQTAAREANFEGPKAFTVDEWGTVALLDQVNQRIQVFERGRPVRVIPLPFRSADDLESDLGGGFAVLDRLVSSTVAFLDPLGSKVGQASVHGRWIPEGGFATALIRRVDGYWVEAGSRFLVRVADSQGIPDAARPIVAGRFAVEADRALRVRIAGPASIEVLHGSLDGKRPLVPLARHSFGMNVHVVDGVETLPDGRLVVAVRLYEEETTAPFRILRSTVRLLVLDSATGRLIATVDVPAPSTPEESFRRLRVGGDGAVYFMDTHAAGVTLWRWQP